MARTFGRCDWLAFCRTTAAHGSLRKLELLESSLLTGAATLRSVEVLRTAPALASAPMPPSECVGLAAGRLLAATPRRARVLDLSAYKFTLPRAALETLAKAAPALTVLSHRQLGAGRAQLTWVLGLEWPAVWRPRINILGESILTIEAARPPPPPQS